MSGPTIAFIVPVHNRWDVAEPLLHALARTTGWLTHARYLVIDDASDMDVSTALDGLPAPFEVIHQREQRGFGRSINEAAASATEAILALINSDLVLAPGWLEPMLDVLANQPHAFAIGNVQTTVLENVVDHAGIIFAHEGYPAHFREPDGLDAERAHREFPAVTAACVLLRRDRFHALGGFDTSYTNGFEDIDLCLRARGRGWPSFVANRSRVGHHVSASPGRKDHEEANARLFLERWRPLTSVWQRDWENRLLWERRRTAGDLTVSEDTPPAPRHGAQRGSRIRVLVDLARLGPGGSNGGIKVLVRESLEALRTLAAGDFAFLLAVPEDVLTEAYSWVGPADELWVLPPREHRTPAGVARVRMAPAADSSLPRLLAADVLYCPLGVSDFLSPDIPAIGVAVAILHRALPECLPAVDVAARERWFDRMVRTSFRIQCNSAWVADRVRHHFGASADALFVVHNAVHTRLGEPVTRSGETAPVFLYPANAWPHKNHDTLLVAYRLYRARAGAAAWNLVLTGHPNDEMRRIEAHARHLGLGDHVQFLGHIPDREFRQLWARTGALVFPSLHEGFGIPVLEAMHQGVPVIAGRIGSIPEVAGDAFLPADVRNPHRLADALYQIATNAELRAELVRRGHARAATFSFEAEIEKLARALREAVATFRSAGISWHWEPRGERHHAHRG